MVLVVSSVRLLATDIKAFELRARNGQSLPAATPGSHIRVTIPDIKGTDTTRAYSLVSDSVQQDRYEIAVLRVHPSGRGSSFMHQLTVGDTIDVSPPRNEFALSDGAEHSILIAGGIGITPILSQLRVLSAQNHSYELHYIARDWDRLIYWDKIVSLAGDRAHFYVSETELHLEAILASHCCGSHVYVCGPYGLIEAVRLIALATGFLRSSIHFESFGYRRAPRQKTLESELRNSGLTLAAEPGQSLLDVVETSGVWVPSECRRGECATCITTVLEGEVAHRDHCLSAEQRAQMICPCVSWPTSDRLVLDL